MPEIQRERIDGARNRTERPSLLECCTGVIRPSLPSFVSRTAFDPIGWIVFNPFLIEGHTDAVGSDIDNLSLSDRRAESVALVLSQQFGVPPENLTTQGYGAHYLKIPTPGPERVNRRVTVRRITPLLTGQNQPLPLAPQ